MWLSIGDQISQDHVPLIEKVFYFPLLALPPITLTAYPYGSKQA
jgi:hypothetical protein